LRHASSGSQYKADVGVGVGKELLRTRLKGQRAKNAVSLDGALVWSWLAGMPCSQMCSTP
jgi:hypothetical protein